jgi:hypothetical protein
MSGTRSAIRLRSAVLGLFVIAFVTGANARQAPLPVPPIPPAQRPSADAPMPDENLLSPFPETPPSRLTLDSGINHRMEPDPGYGYAPGAHYQIDRDRRTLVLPGIRWRLPFP